MEPTENLARFARHGKDRLDRSSKELGIARLLSVNIITCPSNAKQTG
jgi:hypothetical protein